MKDGKKKIALIEDENFLLKAMSERFSSTYNIHGISDGNIAVEEVIKFLPDLILLDLMLPGKNGFEILEEIRREQKTENIPVIVFSNLGQYSDIEKAKKIGIADYIVKADNSLKDIEEKIKKYI